MNEIITVKYGGLTDDLIMVEMGIIYSNRRNQRLKLHLLVPTSFYFEKMAGYKIEKKYPAIVFAAGSGFTHPVYQGRIGLACRMAAHGFIVAMVEYSNFLKGNTFLDTCRDLKTAIRFLRCNADKYHIDPERMAVWGTSSGATNAQFAAFTGNDDAYKTDEYRDYDDSVGALVSFCGPTDLEAFVAPDNPDAQIYIKYWAEHPQKRDSRELCREASTIRLINERRLPPIMLAHGTEDKLVPFSHTENMYKKLVEYGHDVVFYKVDGAAHSNVVTSEMLEIGIQFIESALK